MVTCLLGCRNATGLGRAFTSPEGEGKAVSEMQLSGMKTRVIDFSGSFEPVKLTCRVPLPSGSLCPRQDRYTVRATPSLKLPTRLNRLCLYSVHSMGRLFHVMLMVSH
jgi:hypothetical protein